MLGEALRNKVGARLQERLRPLVDKFDKNEIGDLIDLLVLVANADGTIDQQEQEALQTGIEAIIGSELVPLVVHRLTAESLEKAAETSADERAQAVGQALAKMIHVEDGLRIAITVAYASGGLSTPERNVLSTIARSGSLCSDELDELVGQVAAELED